MKLNMKAIIIAGVVLVAMALEAVVIFMMMPSPQAAAIAGEEHEDQGGHSSHDSHGSHGGHGGHGGHKTTAAADSHGGSNDGLSEVVIDSFNCTNNVVAPGSVIHLSFKVIGVVPSKLQQSFEDNANRTHKVRVRQVIERIARSSSLEDLNDPNLGTIKRLIREEINKTLGRSYVTEVAITDFRMLEQ